MKLLLPLFLLLLGANDNVNLNEVGISLPKTIGQLTFENRQEFEKGLGYSVNYSNKMCRVSMYVYDLNQKDIPEGKDGKPVLEQLDAAKADVALAEEKKYLRNLKWMEKPELPKPVLDHFASAECRFDVRGGPCKGYVLIAGRQSHFLKIRVTQFIVDGKSNDNELNEFLKAVCEKIAEPKN